MPQGPMGQPNQPMQAGPDSPMQKMIFNVLYNRNANFRALADSVKGQNPQEVCQSRGYDYNQIKNTGIDQIKQMLGF